MSVTVQPLRLLASAGVTWTAAQERTIARDYPLADDAPGQFAVRTYLHFLWLPESIMPLTLLVPSLLRVRHPPLHPLLEPLLLSVRAVAAKYHTNLPQILAQDGGEGEQEEAMMWYALSYEADEAAEGSEDAATREHTSRNAWLARLERREVQIQILLYLLKLSLPGPCTPLPPVTIPTRDGVPSKRSRKRVKVVTPSVQERLESFMDKLSTWQLLANMDSTDKDGRDWMQTFCEHVVEPQFKSTLPDMCALLRRKLFPHSPFSDDGHDSDTPPRSHRKLARSSTAAASKGNSRPIQRASAVLSHSDARSRSRSLSVSLAQDASTRRSNATSGTASSLKRALSREVSMSRAFKPRAQAAQPQGPGAQAAAKTKPEAKKDDRRPQGVTLVAATPVKPKGRGGARHARQASTRSQSQHRAFTPDLSQDEDDVDVDLGDSDSDGIPMVRDEDEEMWLPDSSPDVLLLGGGRKRAASGSSSSMGLSDPTEGGMDTPVKKRPRV